MDGMSFFYPLVAGIKKSNFFRLFHLAVVSGMGPILFFCFHGTQLFFNSCFLDVYLEDGAPKLVNGGVASTIFNYIGLTLLAGLENPRKTNMAGWKFFTMNVFVDVESIFLLKNWGTFPSSHVM